MVIKSTGQRELQQIAINHLSNIDFKDFMKIYKKCTVEPQTVERLKLMMQPYHQIIFYVLEKIFWNQNIINHDN